MERSSRKLTNKMFKATCICLVISHMGIQGQITESEVSR